jgi:hypothetical protein
MTAHNFPAAVPCRKAGVAPSPVAAPAVPSKMPCLSCEGKGEAEYMGLCEDRYHWRECHVCEGTGLVAPYCEVCESKLTVDGFCYDCDEYTFADRVPPLPEGWSRIAL